MVFSRGTKYLRINLNSSTFVENTIINEALLQLDLNVYNLGGLIDKILNTGKMKEIYGLFFYLHYLCQSLDVFCFATLRKAWRNKLTVYKIKIFFRLRNHDLNVEEHNFQDYVKFVFEKFGLILIDGKQGLCRIPDSVC